MSDEGMTGKLIAELAKDVYSDAVAPAMKEFGKIGADAVKVVRLALFGMQYGAMLQDRLALRLKDAVDRVPEGQRIAPRESIALPVSERLRYEDAGANVIADLYVNLLARAMDRERVGEAHPAFVQIIGQLAPDEVLVMGQLAEQPHRAFFRVCPGADALSYAETCSKLVSAPFGEVIAETLRRAAVRPENLAQPGLFLTFVEHLRSLGLVEYTNEPKQEGYAVEVLGFQYFFIKLTDFGKLFQKACVARAGE